MKKIISLFLAFVIALGAPIPSFAGYSQVRAPAGYSFSTVGKPATFKSGAASNDTSYRGSTVLTNAALDVGGQVVTVPVALRIAANAGTLAAAYSFGNPAIFAGVAAVAGAALLYDHYKSKGLALDDKGQWVTSDPTICSVAPCYAYVPSEGPQVEFSSAESACASIVSSRTAQFGPRFTYNSVNQTTSQCVMNDTATGGLNGAGISRVSINAKPPVLKPSTVTDFERAIASEPLPVGWPKSLPHFDVPVEAPNIWPSEIPATNPTPLGQPASDPSPRWVPTGDPVKNPNPGPNPDGSPRPDTWTQPGKDVKPSPTPTDPWRVDVTDNPKTKTDPSPNVDPKTPLTETPKPAPPPDIQTCGLPGKPKCQIDELDTKNDKGPTFDAAKNAVSQTEVARKAAIDAAQQIQGPAWSFSFQLPTGCTPLVTGLRGVILDVCQWRGPIHDLMAMVWAGATAFCLIGMVGRTIREA